MLNTPPWVGLLCSTALIAACSVENSVEFIHIPAETKHSVLLPYEYNSLKLNLNQGVIEANVEEVTQSDFEWGFYGERDYFDHPWTECPTDYDAISTLRSTKMSNPCSREIFRVKFEVVRIRAHGFEGLGHCVQRAEFCLLKASLDGTTYVAITVPREMLVNLPDLVTR